MKKVLAFDIGGTHIRCAVVENNKIKKILRGDTPKDKKVFLKRTESFAQELLNKNKNIKAIGISIAGVIIDGVVKKSPNLPIHNFDIKKHFEKKFKRRVEVFNDAGCFSIAEANLGCKKDNFMLITLGTGIGSGLFINGAPYNGGRGLGGEVGHILVEGKDFESHWKKTRNDIKKTFKRKVLFRELVKMKDKRAKKILEEVADYLGKGFASCIAILDPELIVIGGGPSESGPVLLKMINQKLEKYSFVPKKTPVKWTKINEPGIMGASFLVK